jgi:hypothetical protein
MSLEDLRTTPGAKFEIAVEAKPPKFIWDDQSILSKGWSGSVVLSEECTACFVEIEKPCSEWSNEIHLLRWPGVWRQTQIAALLDDGNIYLTYGSKIWSSKDAKWNFPGAKAGIVFRRSKSVQHKAYINFYVQNQMVYQYTYVDPEEKSVADLRLEVRVHPNGALKLV